MFLKKGCVFVFVLERGHYEDAGGRGVLDRERGLITKQEFLTKRKGKLIFLNSAPLNISILISIVANRRYRKCLVEMEDYYKI